MRVTDQLKLQLQLHMPTGEQTLPIYSAVGEPGLLIKNSYLCIEMVPSLYKAENIHTAFKSALLS